MGSIVRSACSVHFLHTNTSPGPRFKSRVMDGVSLVLICTPFLEPAPVGSASYYYSEWQIQIVLYWSCDLQPIGCIPVITWSYSAHSIYEDAV